MEDCLLFVLLNHYLMIISDEVTCSRPSPQGPNDNHAKREEYFRECLKEIAKIPGLVSIAFPHMCVQRIYATQSFQPQSIQDWLWPGRWGLVPLHYCAR